MILSLDYLRRNKMTFVGSNSPYGGNRSTGPHTDATDMLPSTRKAMTVLTQDEFDINTHFAPNKNARKNTFLDSMSNNEYWGLVVACLVAPAIIAAGGTRAIRSYRSYKVKQASIRNARSFLNTVAAFDPAHIPRLVPPPLPPNSDVDIKFPLNNSYPFLLNPGSLPNGITRENWRNMNPDQTIDARKRVSSLSDDELRFFHAIFTNWAHNPIYNDTIYYYVEWALLNKFDPERAQQGYFPLTAVANKGLPADAENKLKRLYDARFMLANEASPAYLEPTFVQNFIEKNGDSSNKA